MRCSYRQAWNVRQLLIVSCMLLAMEGAPAWAQQAFFFGPIAAAKDATGGMFCCGTNVVFRRDALADVGGFPEDSITEDYLLSVRLHERGWTERR